MNGSRQKTRRQPTRMSIERGEAPVIGNAGAEPVVAIMEPESPAATMHLMEEVCERENLVRAWQRVRDNKGAPGVGGRSAAEVIGLRPITSAATAPCAAGRDVPTGRHPQGWDSQARRRPA